MHSFLKETRMFFTFGRKVNCKKKHIIVVASYGIKISRWYPWRVRMAELQNGFLTSVPCSVLGWWYIMTTFSKYLIILQTPTVSVFLSHEFEGQKTKQIFFFFCSEVNQSPRFSIVAWSLIMFPLVEANLSVTRQWPCPKWGFIV